MKVSSKTNLLAGTALILLAAFFSIALLLQPLDFGQFGPGRENFLFKLGEILASVYGFSSILIPTFLFTAAISSFASNWTARKAMRLLTAIVPFFTSVAAEKLIRFFLKCGNFTAIKVSVTIIIASMFVVIEFLLAGIAADKISGKNSIDLHENGNSENETESDGDSESEFEENAENNNAYSAESETESKNEDETESQNENQNEDENPFDKIDDLKESSEDSGDEKKAEAKEDPFEGVFDNVKPPVSDEIEESVFEPKIENEPSLDSNENEAKNSNPSSIISQEEYAALTGFGESDDEPADSDKIEWPNEDEIKAKAGNANGDTSDFDEEPFDFSEADKQENPEDSDERIFEGRISDNEEDFLADDEISDEEEDFFPKKIFPENAKENSDAEDEYSIDEENAALENLLPDEENLESGDEIQAEDEEIPIFGKTDKNKDDNLTLESDFESSFDDYENLMDEKKYDASANPDFFDVDLTRNMQQTLDEENDSAVSEDQDFISPMDIVFAQKKEKKSSLSSEIFEDMENDIRKEVKNEMRQREAETSSPDDSDSDSDDFDSDSDENEKQPENSSRATAKKSYFVPTDLLQQYDDDQYWLIDEGTKSNAVKLKNTLTDFGISAEVIGIKKGPVVTMYELEPAPGVRLSKIVSLQDNIALSLAASSVRIVAPIPGRAAVGIEVPNKQRSIVSFREMIEQDLPEFKKMAIPVVLGKDILGKSQIIDITKTPHLLIAGATGAGKSVCVNSIILSILYKKSPQQVKMILVDPKVVELKLYNDIPHLLTPVITEPKKALQSLQWCLCEMERRYALLDQMGVRDIANYNIRIEERNICTEKLPYIVIIIDEFADLMATSGKELESNVARLAAMSRAVGIHLVLATQRPSVNVITGLIKANIPSRIAFMVASRTDSNIIIDAVGAEKLLGKGDMLYASAADPYPVRIQGTFESDGDVEKVVEYVKTLGEPDYIDDQMFIDEEEDDYGGPSLFSEGADPLYDQALDIVLQAGKASASYIQRRLKIGYNRAARLVEEMEERGIVGPANGSKPREVIHMPN